MMRSDGTLSRRAAILSLRLVLYRFSIMLCAVFFTGWSSSSSSSSSSTSADDLRFLLLILCGSAVSGDERVPLSWPLEAESGLPAPL